MALSTSSRPPLGSPPVRRNASSRTDSFDAQLCAHAGAFPAPLGSRACRGCVGEGHVGPLLSEGHASVRRRSSCSGGGGSKDRVGRGGRRPDEKERAAFSSWRRASLGAQLGRVPAAEGCRASATAAMRWRSRAGDGLFRGAKRGGQFARARRRRTPHRRFPSRLSPRPQKPRLRAAKAAEGAVREALRASARAGRCPDSWGRVSSSVEFNLRRFSCFHRALLLAPAALHPRARPQDEQDVPGHAEQHGASPL